MEKVHSLKTSSLFSWCFKAPALLTYLESRLRFLQTLEPGDQIRIVLDPLAEYLAALHLVERCQEHPEDDWGLFLDSIDAVLADTHEPPKAIQSFLLAVRDCSLLKQKAAHVPDTVPETLARKAGLDPNELYRIEGIRRIRLLISDLSAPELEYRLRAADDLGHWGTAAAVAIPNLLGMVTNLNQTIVARQMAAQTLGKLGQCSDALRETIVQPLIKLLQDTKDEPSVRRSVAEALGTLNIGQAELQRILASDDEPLSVRQGSAFALSLMVAPGGEPVAMLVVKQQQRQVEAQVKWIPVWQEGLAENLTLELVAIPRGKFLMGSPESEEGRDDYLAYFPDTDGLTVEAQHWVSVSSFWMSRYPITQAQWRVVAALPKVNHDLRPDPANFKGDNRPIEKVAWYEAVEN